MEKIDDILDDDKLNEAIKKGKIKSKLRIIATCILVFIVGYFINNQIVFRMSIANRQREEKNITFSIPNGRLGDETCIVGLLGGVTSYSVYKEVGWRPVFLYNSARSFGLGYHSIISSGGGYGGHSSDGWPLDCWENGYKKLMFFHPNIKYKEYKRDFSELDKISNGKIIEMGLSLDKGYDASELRNIIPNANISWMWLDTYTKEQMDQYKKEAEEYDARSTYISEQSTLGVKTEGNLVLTQIYKDNYSGLLNTLRKQGNQDLYKHLKERKNTPAIIGVTVYGTPSELKILSKNPHIKAAAIGVMRDNN